MDSHKTRDLVAGVALMAFGIVFGAYAVVHLKLGTFAQMGPGMFPLLMGGVVAMLGLALIVATASRTRPEAVEANAPPPEKADWRTLAIVVLSVLAFALMIRRVGLVPSVYGLVLVASLASDKLPPVKALVLASLLAFIGWLIFIFALGLPIKLIAWPL